MCDKCLVLVQEHSSHPAHTWSCMMQYMFHYMGILVCVTWDDHAGAITTLGRGGSDLSATFIGAALGVPEVVVWKDVDGMYHLLTKSCHKLYYLCFPFVRCPSVSCCFSTTDFHMSAVSLHMHSTTAMCCTLLIGVY